MRLPLFMVATLVAAIPAIAHSWYPLACCGNMDCFPVACDQLVETVSGWLYVPTGNLFKREQVQPSSRVRTPIAMYASGAVANTAQSARSSYRTCSGRSPASVGRTNTGCKIPACPLTDRLQFDILQRGPGWWVSNALRSIETARVIRLIFSPVKWALLALEVSGTLPPRHFGFILRSRLIRSPRRRGRALTMGFRARAPSRS